MISDSPDRDDGTNMAGSSPGRTERALDSLHRVLQYRVSVGALAEVAVWLAIPYLSLGLVWAFLHTETTQRIQARLEPVFPVGADVLALGVTAAFWPASIEIADACPAK